MLPLPMVSPQPNVLLAFGSQKLPLRPSKLSQFIACPMSLVLSLANEGVGGQAAQTGNLIHVAAQAFHTETVLDPVAAGLQALADAREKFPVGDQEKAATVFRAYAADPQNRNATVLWCETAVRLVLPAAPGDPTGEPIVIEGVLDQVRRHSNGVLRVWDIKTGDRLTADECIDEHMMQQACYVLAARATLDASIEPGGLIYTPAFLRNRGKRFIDLPLTVSSATVLMSLLPPLVSAVRRGVPAFNPGVESCRWCEFKRFPACLDALSGLLGTPRVT